MWSDKNQARPGIAENTLEAVQSSDWQTEEIYSDADRYFESLLLGIDHAKAMLVDAQCLIGNTNLNHRSFLHDLELDVVLSSEVSIEKIKSLLEQDMENSLILTLDNVSKWHRFILFGWLLRIIRYWM